MVIIGGGITGLAAAYELTNAMDMPHLEVTLLEKDQQLGGKLRTDRVDGFVIELGPDAFVSYKPGAVQLCRQLGLQDELEGTNSRQRKVYIVREGELVELPDGLAMMVPGRVAPMLTTPLLSWAGKARMALDLFLPAKRDAEDESVGAFIRRRLGREAYEHLIEPLMSGIYAGDGDQLSLMATFPILRHWEAQSGSLALSAWRLRQKRRQGDNGRAASIFLTPRRGMQTLAESLVSHLGAAELRPGDGAISLRAHGSHFEVGTHSGETLKAGAVILASPAHTSASLVRRFSPELAERLEEIEYVSTATVSLAYEERHLGRPLDGHGYVVPRVEGSHVLACTWTSTKFPHRAPPEHALLRVFIGGAGRSQAVDLRDEDLVGLARQELAQRLDLSAEPLLARAKCWPLSMPQYNVGHLDRVAGIRQLSQAWPGLQVAGAAYDGVGIPDCIDSGRAAARRAAEALRQTA